jgi:hypothetical protein
VITLFRESDDAAVVVDSDDVLGYGVDGHVLRVDGRTDVVAKLYDQPAEELARRLRAMVANPASTASVDGNARHASVAWPLDLLRDEQGRFAGALMRSLSGEHRLSDVLDPARRRLTTPTADYALLHRVAHGLAAAFGGLHDAGYVVGGLDAEEVLVDRDGRVILVRPEAMQATDGATGEVFPCLAGRPELAPPELHGRVRGPAERGPEQDRFTLGILIFQLLMEGAHPFAGEYVGPGEAPSLPARIAGGFFPYLPGSQFGRPREAPPLDVLAPAVRDLVRRCFDAGHRDPAARPSPSEWAEALASAEPALAGCAANPMHRFGSHLGACPWCGMARTLGRDPFPAAGSASGPTASSVHTAPLDRVAPKPADPSASPPRPYGTGQRPKIPASTGFGPLGESGMWLAAVAAAGLLGFAAGSPRVFLLLAACIVFGGAIRLLDRSAGGSLALMLGALVVAMTGIAWSGQRPSSDSYPVGESFDIRTEAEARSHLTFDPVALDSMPVLVHSAELSTALQHLTDTRDTVQVSFVVDAAGRIDSASIRFPDPLPAGAVATRAALAGQAFFHPGIRHGEPVRTRVDVPVLTSRRRSSALLAEGTWNRRASHGGPSGGAPGKMRVVIPDTAFAVAPPSGRRIVRMAVDRSPVLLNRKALVQALAEAYPSTEAGRPQSQVAIVQLRVTESGTVDPASPVAADVMKDPSPAFVAAALRVARTARFRPALVHEKPAAVWAALPMLASTVESPAAGLSHPRAAGPR